MEPVIITDIPGLPSVVGEQTQITEGNIIYTVTRGSRRPNIGHFKPGLYWVVTKKEKYTDTTFEGFAISPEHALRQNKKQLTKKQIWQRK